MLPIFTIAVLSTPTRLECSRPLDVTSNAPIMGYIPVMGIYSLLVYSPSTLAANSGQSGSGSGDGSDGGSGIGSGDTQIPLESGAVYDRSSLLYVQLIDESGTIASEQTRFQLRATGGAVLTTADGCQTQPVAGRLLKPVSCVAMCTGSSTATLDLSAATGTVTLWAGYAAAHPAVGGPVRITETFTLVAPPFSPLSSPPIHLSRDWDCARFASGVQKCESKDSPSFFGCTAPSAECASLPTHLQQTRPPAPPEPPAPPALPPTLPPLSPLPHSPPPLDPRAPPISPPSPNPHSAWMSGKHGIGYRIAGGVHYGITWYDPVDFANNVKDLPVSWVIVGLSSGAFGDRYLAPHPLLTNLSRGSTPKCMWLSKCGVGYERTTFESGDVPLESFPDRDVFDELLTAMEAVGIKVIAYMAAQGPAMLKAGETSAYDYNNRSPYVDSCALCPELTGVVGCACAPSVHLWRKWVRDNYGDDEEPTLHRAYAEVIVGEYAKRYGPRIAGFWFDQGGDADGSLIAASIRQHNPNAAIAYNSGLNNPLRNNNPGIEDYTFGHVTPVQRGKNPPDGCYNYGMVVSAESTNGGWVYNEVSPFIDYSRASDPSTRPNTFTYTVGGEASLAHVFMPVNTAWNSGEIVWNVAQAREWQARVMRAGGAWTWNVARTGCAGCVDTYNQALVDTDDLAFLKQVYDGLPGGPDEVQPPYFYNDTNCDCCSAGASPSTRQWGCQLSASCERT